MSEFFHNKRFPGESDAYRSKRNKLLAAEKDLRQKLEDITKLRRQLPLGGKVKEDYFFDEIRNGIVKQTKLSELLQPGKNSLIVYSFMYGPQAEAPCPMCTSFLDSADSSSPHITQRTNFVVVAKSPINRIRDWTDKRGWKNLRLLSSANNTYNSDYFSETPEGHQLPACNVFTKADSGIHHFYSTELLYTKLDGQPRHVDLLWPLWNFFDLIPEGRGTDWYPKLSYK